MKRSDSYALACVSCGAPGAGPDAVRLDLDVKASTPEHVCVKCRSASAARRPRQRPSSMAGPLNATLRVCPEPSCIRTMGHTGDHVNYLDARTASDRVTADLIAEAVGYAEGVLEDMALPWPVEDSTKLAMSPTWTSAGKLVALSVAESVELQEWACGRIAKAWAMGYAAALDDLSNRKARRVRK